MSEPAHPTPDSIGGNTPATATPAQPTRRKLSLRKKILFLIIFFTLLFGIPEAAIRIFLPQYAYLQFSETLTGGRPVGQRGGNDFEHLVYEPRQPREIRFAMLGDSVMWGCGLSEEDSIPAQVQRKLREKRPDIPWRCVNLAGQGVTPASRRDQVLADIDKWPVDAVIYQFHLNDVAWTDDQLTQKAMKVDGGFSGLFRNGGQVLRVKYLRASALLAFIEQQAKMLYRYANGPFDPATSGLASGADSDVIRARWDQQFAAMADVKAACDRLGRGFRVYVFPQAEFLSADPRDNLEYYDRSKITVDPFQRFDDYCSKYNLPGRHLFREVKAQRDAMLSGGKPYNRLFFTIDTNHPNPRGAEIFADAIVEDILSGRVLPIPAP